jgi:HEAT repeat protein
MIKKLCRTFLLAYVAVAWLAVFTLLPPCPDSLETEQARQRARKAPEKASPGPGIKLLASHTLSKRSETAHKNGPKASGRLAKAGELTNSSKLPSKSVKKNPKGETKAVLASEINETVAKLILKKDRRAWKKLKMLLANPKETLEAIKNLLTDTNLNDEQRLDSLTALALLVKRLEQGGGARDEAAATIAAAYKVIEESGLPILETALKNPDKRAQGLKALKILRMIKPRSEFVAWIKQSFDSSKHHGFKRQAVKSLGNLSFEESGKALFKILTEDKRARYRNESYHGILKSMSMKTFQELQTIINESDDPLIKVTAIDLVASYANRQSRSNNPSKEQFKRFKETLSDRIDELEAALNNKTLPRNVHREAISALGEIGGFRALAILKTVLKTGPNQFYIAAAALNLNNHPEGRDVLRTCLRDETRWVSRLLALEYLLNGGPRVRNENPNIDPQYYSAQIFQEGLVNHKKARDRANLVRRLGSRPGVGMDRVLIDLFQSEKETNLRLEAAFQLSKHHSQSPFADEVIPTLIETVESNPNNRLRRRAAQSIGEVGLIRSYGDAGALIRAHPDSQLRLWLLRQFRLNNWQRNAPLLVELQETDPVDSIRKTAEYMLKRLSRFQISIRR